MKFIRVPQPIQTCHPLTKDKLEFYSFAKYAVDVWLNDPRMIGTAIKVARLGKIVSKFIDTPAGSVLELEDADYEVVVVIVKAPTMHYAPLIEMQLQPFSAAVLEAKDLAPAIAAAPSQG